MNFYEKTISKETIFEGKVVSLYIHNVELPNGKESTREIVVHRGAVGIVPVDNNGNVILIKQFRKPVEEELWEIPAGKLDNGETPEKCAERELCEEIGFKPTVLIRLTSIYTSPGFSNEVIHLFLAKGLEEDKIENDEDEFLTSSTYTFDELMGMINQGKIKDSKTITGILIARELL